MATCLVLTADPVIAASQVTELLASSDVPLEAVAVATSSGRLTVADLGRAAYESAHSVGPAGHHSLQLLGALATALKPGGQLLVREPSGQDTLSKNLLLSGFAASEALPDGSGFTARTPSWAPGAKAAISLQPKPAADAKSTWTLAADGADEDDLVDADELLTEEDLARPPPPAPADDCEVGAAGRKACADCSCGRADGDAKPQKLTQEMLNNPTTGCGSCALGDAFRCGGCPYRGLPAFELGKKIELPADFLVSDL